MSRNFPFQHFLKPSMEQTSPREEEQLEFDSLNETLAEPEISNHKNLNKPEDNEELTKKIRNIIKDATSHDKFNAFFRNLEVLHLTNSDITFFVPTAFIKTMAHVISDRGIEIHVVYCLLGCEIGSGKIIVAGTN